MRLVIAPNASMSGGTAFAAFLTAAVAAAVPCGVLALRGFWPMVLCAVVALAALAGALRAGLRQNRYRELIRSDGPELLVEYGHTGTGPTRTVYLPRAWTRVALHRGPYRNSPSRLLLHACGRHAEVGRCLAEPERERLALRLGQLIGSAWKAGGSPVSADSSLKNTEGRV